MCNYFSSADRALAKRIEAADAAIIRNLLLNSAPFAAEAFAGGWSIFAGAGSPMTHVVGAGMCGPVSEEERDLAEDFYRERASACVIDLCPLADEQLIRMIQARPYRVVEFNNVLVRPLPVGKDPSLSDAAVRRILPGEHGTWVRVVAAGFADADDPPPGSLDVFAGIAGMPDCFLAELDGRSSAGGAMGMHDGIAWFSGDATLPRSRGRGLQSGLIRARLAWAADNGCDLACAAVLPGSASHRNYDRAGFRLLYMRVNVMRELHREVRP